MMSWPWGFSRWSRWSGIYHEIIALCPHSWSNIPISCNISGPSHVNRTHSSIHHHAEISRDWSGIYFRFSTCFDSSKPFKTLYYWRSCIKWDSYGHIEPPEAMVSKSCQSTAAFILLIYPLSPIIAPAAAHRQPAFKVIRIRTGLQLTQPNKYGYIQGTILPGLSVQSIFCDPSICWVSDTKTLATGDKQC